MHQKFKIRKEKFAQNIYRYCDSRIGEEALFLAFMNLYPSSGKRNRKSLAKHTSRIINELVWNGVLKEIPKDPSFSTPYGLYKILNHKRIIPEIGYVRDPYDFDFTQS